MPNTPAIEVPVTPRVTIPFHEGESVRIEIDRTTVVAGVPVRARDCDILVDGERLRGVQAVVVRDFGDTRTVGVVIKTKRPEGAADVEKLTTEDETARHGVTVHLGSPETGDPIRSYLTADARVIAQSVDERWARLDFVGAPTEMTV